MFYCCWSIHSLRAPGVCVGACVCVTWPLCQDGVDNLHLLLPCNKLHNISCLLHTLRTARNQNLFICRCTLISVYWSALICILIRTLYIWFLCECISTYYNLLTERMFSSHVCVVFTNILLLLSERFWLWVTWCGLFKPDPDIGFESA